MGLRTTHHRICVCTRNRENKPQPKPLQKSLPISLHKVPHNPPVKSRDKDAQHRKSLSEAKSTAREQQSALERQLRDLQSHLREKESQLRLIQASSKSIQQKANQDAIDLDEQAETLTKRHIKEINGLAKQIQFLRARCSRAEAFREALGYQKKFFLMQIQTYNEWYVSTLLLDSFCNTATNTSQ